MDHLGSSRFPNPDQQNEETGTKLTNDRSPRWQVHWDLAVITEEKVLLSLVSRMKMVDLY